MKVLLDPQQMLDQVVNLWRKLAVTGEDCQVEKNSEATEKEMVWQQVLRYTESCLFVWIV